MLKRSATSSGGATLHDEGDLAGGQGGLDIGQPLQHEVVVPSVGLGIVIHQPERDQQGQLELVRAMHRVFQRVVELGALRLLHPVEDIVAAEVVAVWVAVVEQLHPLGLDPGVDVVGCGVVGLSHEPIFLRPVTEDR